MARPAISVAMIAKNSEQHLEEVLRSVRWAEEIVIVLDPQTTDRTREIATAHGAKVIECAWEGFAKQKNRAIAATSSPWVLSLDDDELVDDELNRAICAAPFSTADGFRIARKNYIGDKWIRHSGFYPDRQLRLFRRDLRYREDLPVHEQIDETGKRILPLAGHLVHYTYASYNEYLAKAKRYAALDAEVLYAEGRRWSWWYQIGKPLKEFVRRYLGLRGYRDGYAGFMIACVSAYSRWLTAWQLRKLG